MNPINNIMKLATDLAYCTDDEFGEIKVALRAAIEQALTPGEPDGWKLVPVEPTTEMLKALGNPWDRANLATWRRVIAAAPQPQPDDTALLQQCLEALDAALSDDKPYIKECKEAVAAIKERLK